MDSEATAPTLLESRRSQSIKYDQLLADSMAKDVEKLVPEVQAADLTAESFFFGYRWLKLMVFTFTGLFMVFIYGLPFWSYVFNDHFGYVKTLCETPARDITCGNGANYTLLAQALGRYNAEGHLVGCSCEDGLLADWACAANTSQFSISYFISTAPGTGAMAALSAWPILGMWMFGFGSERVLKKMAHPCQQAAIWLSLAAFQFFYGLFLIGTCCVFPVFHGAVVVLFNTAAVVHYLIIACIIGKDTWAGKIITGLTYTGVAAIAIGYAFPKSDAWTGQHLFWICESIGLSSGFLIAPVLMILLK